MRGYLCAVPPFITEQPVMDEQKNIPIIERTWTASGIISRVTAGFWEITRPHVRLYIYLRAHVKFYLVQYGFICQKTKKKRLGGKPSEGGMSAKCVSISNALSRPGD